MSTLRRCGATIGLVVVVLAMATAIALISSPSRARRDTVAKVRVGMTRAEVHELIGEPDFQGTGLGRTAADGTFEVPSSNTPSGSQEDGFGPVLGESWMNKDVLFTIYCDTSDIVIHTDMSPGQRKPFVFWFLRPPTVTWPPTASPGQ